MSEILPTIYELRIACREALDVTDAQFVTSRSKSASWSRALYCTLLADIFKLTPAEVADACGVDRTTAARLIGEMKERVESSDPYTLSLIDRAERFAAALVHVRLGPVAWRKEPES